MAEVAFKRGLSTALPSERDGGTFYWVTDTKKLYIGSDEITGSSGGATASELQELKAFIGQSSDLTTTEKSTIVGAINELVTKIAAAAVTLEEDESSTDYAKVYTIKQGGNSIGAINIPKDMVVKSGVVVENPEGKDPGTYIELTLANSTEDKIYVKVDTLISLYTAESNATQVQLFVNNVTKEISATIVGSSVTSAELADNAVTEDKIADNTVSTTKIKPKAVTLSKLAQDVTDAFDAAGAASTAAQSVKDYVDQKLTWGTF